MTSLPGGINSNDSYPKGMHTPDLTPAAALFDDPDEFFEAAPIISVAAQQTSTLEFMYGVIDCVRRPPALLAQTMLTLDHATKGRTMTLMAIGENKQMKPYGMSRKGVSDKLWDATHMIRLLLDNREPVSYEGRLMHLDKALLSLPPYGKRPPKLWLAGGTEQVQYLAGSLADGWASYAPGGTDDNPQVFRDGVERVKRFAQEAGRDPDSIDIILTVVTRIHEDRQLLTELRDHPLIRWFTLHTVPNLRYFGKWDLEHPTLGTDWAYSQKFYPYQFSREEGLALAAATPQEFVDHAYMNGTPEEVYEQITPYLDAGVTHLFLWNLHSWVGVEPDYLDQLRAQIRAR